MAVLVITDKNYNIDNLRYISSSESEFFSATGSGVFLAEEGERAVLRISCPEEYLLSVKKEVCDKIADVIAVNYKYLFFTSRIAAVGLDCLEKEILLTSLISADLPEDKKYAYSKLIPYDTIAIDGFFNFRMKLLKNKWEGIVACIPEYFKKEQLKDFVTYLIEDKNNKIFIENGNVYDEHFKRLSRGELMDKGLKEGRVIREVLLSGGGNIELNSPLNCEDERYMREYFGGKITLGKGYFS